MNHFRRYKQIDSGMLVISDDEESSSKLLITKPSKEGRQNDKIIVTKQIP